MHKFAYLFVALILASTAAFGQGVPPNMSYQGYVTDLTGTPVTDGNYNFTFAIYTTEAGGVALWTETHPTVAVAKGLFNVVLGRGNPANPLVIPFDQAYFLGIRMGADPEMTPRVRLTTSAYSFRSAVSDGVRDGVITNASVAPGANIAPGKLDPTVLTESEIVAGSGVTVTNSGGTLTIAASPGAVTLAGDVTGPAGSNTIANGAVTNPKLADNSVSTSKIQDYGVTQIKIQDGCIKEMKLADNAVTQPKINATGAAAGRFLGFDGANMVWQTPPGGGGLTLPYVGSGSYGADAFSITNTGAGAAGAFVSSPGGTSTIALHAISNSTNALADAVVAEAKAGIALYALNSSATSPTSFMRNDGGGDGLRLFGDGNGHNLYISKSSGAGRAINVIHTGTTQSVYVDATTSGNGLELKQSGAGQAAYFHVDNPTSTQNAVYAESKSSSISSDAFQAKAVGGRALYGESGCATGFNTAYIKNTADGGAYFGQNTSATNSTVTFQNLSATPTAKIINTNGGFNTDVQGQTTSKWYIASQNLGSGVPAAGGLYRDNVVCAWARVSSTGAALSSFGCTVTRTGVGTYVVTYNNPFTSGNDVCPVVTAHYASGARFAMCSIVTATTLTIETYSSTGVLADSYFHVIVVGRQ
jgi:hypothetical protein